MGPVELHPTLKSDCHVLGRVEGAWLLLHRDAGLPWFILVPDTEHSQLHELERSARRRLTERWDELSSFVLDYFDCERINQAAIGNRVEQLHLHVVGRRQDDPCWPDVVWGRLSTEDRWSPERLEVLVEDLRVGMGLVPAP